MNSSNQDIHLDRLARKRAAAKLGWYTHAAVYIAVNLMLAMIATSSGRQWAVFPAMGWGIGLLAHGAVVFVFTGGAGLFDKLVQQERTRLASQRDPW